MMAGLGIAHYDLFCAPAVLVRGIFLCSRFAGSSGAAHRCGAAILVGFMVSFMVHVCGGAGFLWLATTAFVGHLLFLRRGRAYCPSRLSGKAQFFKARQAKLILTQSNLYITP